MFATSKCDFLRSCIARDIYPKGTTPVVPLKIMDTPEHLKNEWEGILSDCARKLTKALVNFHHSKIVRQEQLAEKVVFDASQLIIPEHITDVPDIPSKIESSIQSLLANLKESKEKIFQ